MLGLQQGNTMTQSSRKLLATLAVLATVSSAFFVSPVQAKSAKCSALPVAGQPGHYIVVCSRVRP
jgi:hypothetical protein